MAAMVTALCNLPVMRTDATEMAAAVPARGIRPGADGAHIDMHEMRRRVVADAALIERKRSVAKARRG